MNATNDDQDADRPCRPLASTRDAVKPDCPHLDPVGRDQEETYHFRRAVEFLDAYLANQDVPTWWVIREARRQAIPKRSFLAALATLGVTTSHHQLDTELWSTWSLPS